MTEEEIEEFYVSQAVQDTLKAANARVAAANLEKSGRPIEIFLCKHIFDVSMHI